jgi:hypothetical protein
MVFIPREMSDELIARFRVGCPILLRYKRDFNGPMYIIIELSQWDTNFAHNRLEFVKDRNIQVSESDENFPGGMIYHIQDSFGVHSRISWKISLETFEKVCQCLKKNC